MSPGGIDSSTDGGAGRAVRAVRAMQAGDPGRAGRLLAPALADLAGAEVTGLRFTSDEYSLNSVSGLIELAGGGERFFKLHAEEGEDEQVTEYYRATLLADAGLPVEVPLAVNTTPGEQLVLYEVRHDPRMVDVCLDAELADPARATLTAPWADARRELDETIGRVLVATLAPPCAASARAAIHQLFHRRLADPDHRLGGSRFARFYAQDDTWRELSAKRWRVGGVEYDRTLHDIVTEAADTLAPEMLAAGPVVTAHGDDHHGNVWCRTDGGRPRLTLFDPAFAGADIPALLALAKPTYHNALAHPFWLYHPGRVGHVRATLTADVVRLDVPAELNPLREYVLDSIVEHGWIPLLRAMALRGELPAGWRRVVRLALALCPLLVTDLTATSRSRDARLVGLARVAVAGGEPVVGSDPLTRALDRMQQAVDTATTATVGGSNGAPE